MRELTAETIIRWHVTSYEEADVIIRDLKKNGYHIVSDAQHTVSTRRDGIYDRYTAQCTVDGAEIESSQEVAKQLIAETSNPECFAHHLRENLGRELLYIVGEMLGYLPKHVS